MNLYNLLDTQSKIKITNIVFNLLNLHFIFFLLTSHYIKVSYMTKTNKFIKFKYNKCQIPASYNITKVAGKDT